MIRLRDRSVTVTAESRLRAWTEGRVGPRGRSRRAPSSPSVQRPIPASIGGARSRDHSHTTPSPRVPNSTHAHTHTHARTALARVSGEGQFAVRARARSHTLRLRACEQTPDMAVVVSEQPAGGGPSACPASEAMSEKCRPAALPTRVVRLDGQPLRAAKALTARPASSETARLVGQKARLRTHRLRRGRR